MLFLEVLKIHGTRGLLEPTGIYFFFTLLVQISLCDHPVKSHDLMNFQFLGILSCPGNVTSSAKKKAAIQGMATSTRVET